jgi:HK97 family phage major capsid protein
VSRHRIIGTRRDGRPIFLIAGGDGSDDPKPQAGQNPYRTLQDMETRLRTIQAELARIDGIDDPTDEDAAFQGTLIQEYDKLNEDASPLRKRMADIRRITQAAQDPENREAGVPRQQAPEVHVRSNRDPFEDLDRVRQRLVSTTDLRTRAEVAIEQDHKRYELTQGFAETATVRAQTNSRVAAHILLTGSQEYRNAFRDYLEDPVSNDQRARIALSIATGSAGFMLPYVLDPTIVLTNAGSANPFRRIARTETTTSNAWQGVNSAGSTANWIAEATTASETSPVMGQIQITPVKGVSWIIGSFEALDDTNVGAQLPQILADARDRLEAGSFATGSGTAVPLGIMAALGTANRVLVTTTGAVVAADVYNTQAALDPRWRNSPRVGWLAHLIYINKIRAIDTSGGSSFWANFGSDTPEQLLGKSIYESSAMASGTAATTGTGGGVLLFGDWEQFIIVDRVGVSMLYDPMLKGTGNAQLPTGQAGWYMFWRSSSGVSTANAFKFLVNGSA